MKIELKLMTRERMHEFYRGFAMDPDLFADMELYEKVRDFRYDPGKVDARFDRRMGEADSVSFAVTLGGRVIGEVVLKHVDADKKECELSIHLQNDSVKNRGFGTEAERLAVRYAFEALDLESVYADTILKNTRSQRALEKAGFIRQYEKDGFRIYRLERKDWKERTGQPAEEEES